MSLDYNLTRKQAYHKSLKSASITAEYRYNSRGTVVRELVFGMKAAGYYTGRSSAAHWDGRNRSGERVSSGMYFYQFKTDSIVCIKEDGYPEVKY